MTGDPPGLRELMRAGVRRSVAEEYRRLISVGVSRDVALVLACGPCRDTGCRREGHAWRRGGSACAPWKGGPGCSTVHRVIPR